MQFVISQNASEMVVVSEFFRANTAVSGDKIILYCTSVSEGKKTSYVMGYFKDTESARFVMRNMFDVLSAGGSYEIPKEADLPDLRFLRTHGGVTSMKVGHGGS